MARESPSTYFLDCSRNGIKLLRYFRLITIFDTRISLSWTGKTSDGTEVSGSLIIPEVSHEILCDKLSGFQVITFSFVHTDVKANFHILAVSMVA